LLNVYLQRYRKEARDDEETTMTTGARLRDLDDPHYKPYVPVRERKREKLAKLGDRLTREKVRMMDSSESEKDDDNSEDEEDAQALARKENISLMDQHTELKRLAEGS
jgi:ATP-dependent RNA helicase DDX41